MASPRTARTVRLLERVDEGVDSLAARTGRDRSAVVNELLEEGLKMRRIPGVVFADGVSRRVVRVAGTGLEVWEIIRSYQSMNSDLDRLRAGYHWLTENQLRAALAYAEAYPDEIAARIRRDEEWTPEKLWETYPFMRPSYR